MSSSTTIVNDREHGDRVQQPITATGRLRGTRRQLPVLPSKNDNPVVAVNRPVRQMNPSTPDGEPGTGSENPRPPSRRRTISPIAAAEPGTGPDHIRRAKKRTALAASVQSGSGSEISWCTSQRRTPTPIPAVEPGTGAGYLKRTKHSTNTTATVQSVSRIENSRRPSQRIPSPIAAAAPSTGLDHMRHAKKRTALATSLQSGGSSEISRCTTQRTLAPIPTLEPGTSAGHAKRTKHRTSPTPAVHSVIARENSRHESKRTPAPIPAVEPGTGAGHVKRTKHWTSTTVAVQPVSRTENSRRPSQRTPSPIAVVEPGTRVDGTWHSKKTAPAAALESGRRERNSTQERRSITPPMTDEEESDTELDNTRPRPRRLRVFERDLTPEQRAIPDTELLHDLGYHLSAYTRAGLGLPTQNLNCRGAWRTAIELYDKANDEYKELFYGAGFEDFLSIKPVDVPIAYNLALTERWFSETNTLHLPCCEIGPTPVDWTMITGVRFGGQRIEFDPDFKMETALDLLGKPGAQRDGKINLASIKPTSRELKDIAPTDDAKEKIFRRLFLYVVGSCFFSNNRSVISHHLVKFVEDIDEVQSYDWGSITFATFLAGMRRKVTAEIGALTAFWQFLPFWAFEYLDVSRPKHEDGDFFPRAKRWICPKGFSNNESTQFLANRCQLNYVEESQVTWKPYPRSAYRSNALESALHFSKMRIPFQGIGTWEYYLGERCRRQLGFRCKVPNAPPEIMHGTKDRPEGVSAEGLVKEGVDYASWFRNNSIGNILNVTRCLGGPEIAGKVIDQWLAKHQPDLILVEQSQYEKIKEDRDALEEECAKLREELSQARGESSNI